VWQEEKNSVTAETLDFHSLSYADSSGRLFWNDGHLYRGLSPALASFYSQLFHKGVIDGLINDRLLIDTKLTDETTRDYPCVVEHSVVPFVSYAHEWCPEMLRSAGRLVLDLVGRLHARNLELIDGHSGNILFQGPHPVWVDLCAVQPGSGTSAWVAADQFRSHFLNPL
jgi:hypothetical protein